MLRTQYTTAYGLLASCTLWLPVFTVKYSKVGISVLVETDKTLKFWAISKIHKSATWNKVSEAESSELPIPYKQKMWELLAQKRKIWETDRGMAVSYYKTLLRVVWLQYSKIQMKSHGCKLRSNLARNWINFKNTSKKFS